MQKGRTQSHLSRGKHAVQWISGAVKTVTLERYTNYMHHRNHKLHDSQYDKVHYTWQIPRAGISTVLRHTNFSLTFFFFSKNNPAQLNEINYSKYEVQMMQ